MDIRSAWPGGSIGPWPIRRLEIMVVHSRVHASMHACMHECMDACILTSKPRLRRLHAAVIQAPSVHGLIDAIPRV